ncbi:hypothetical protein NL676_026443 [Syzygium grande]|nr:hypothetical protein NL676_026443 [Syzygium grande]
MTVLTKGFLQGRLPEELKKVLRSVASELGDVIDDMDAIQVVPLKGAMTNEVYQINWPLNDECDLVRKVLVRIYGEGVELFFNRDDELRTFECMSRHGQGPRLLGRFSVGRVEEFIHARTLSAADLRDPDVSALIASKLREFNNLEMPGSEECSPLGQNKKLAQGSKIFELTRDDQAIGFCHNDLQYGNIMMDEETRLITLIDYEYASYNPVAFDIANHFCEMAANYHTETPHILDYGAYPGLEERKRFVCNYLSSGGDQPNDTEINQLVEDAEKYTLANHLFWGLWGIISVYVSNIDFDYREYAWQRIQQYWLRRPALLGSGRVCGE